MIRDIAQFLEELVSKEARMLAKEDVKHPGIINCLIIV